MHSLVQLAASCQVISLLGSDVAYIPPLDIHSAVNIESSNILFLSDLFLQFFPELGPYSSRDAAVIAKHFQVYATALLLPIIYARRSIAAGYVEQVAATSYNVSSAHNVEQRHLVRHSQLVGQERLQQWRLAGMGW